MAIATFAPVVTLPAPSRTSSSPVRMAQARRITFARERARMTILAGSRFATCDAQV
jgi:hypothetical protein